MNRLILLGTYLLMFAVTAVGAEDEKKFESFDEIFRQRAEMAISEKETARSIACALIVLGPRGPGDVKILFKLAQDRSPRVRYAAVEAVVLSAFGDEDARRFAELFESEFKHLIAIGGGTTRDTEALLPCTYLWGMHELYYRNPIKSPAEFAEFETDTYSAWFAILGEEWKGGAEVLDMFFQMTLAVKGAPAWENALVCFEAALNTGDLEFQRRTVLCLEGHEYPKSSPSAKASYERWLKRNATAFENLAGRDAEKPDFTEPGKVVTQYLNQVILPIVRGGAPDPSAYRTVTRPPG